MRGALPDNPRVYEPHKGWLMTMEEQETAMCHRYSMAEANLTEHTKELTPLEVGQSVMVQNQTGNHPLKWDKSGVVWKVMPFKPYEVKMDGTGRITPRNRKFLHPIKTYAQIWGDGPERDDLPRHGNDPEEGPITTRFE